MSNLYVFEGVNLMVGDEGPDNSKHINLKSIKLPSLIENAQEHSGGGSIGAISIGGMGLQALEAPFSVAGIDPQVHGKFAGAVRTSTPFTVYGAVRDKRTGNMIELKSVMRGRLREVTIDELSRADLAGSSYVIHEIYNYSLHLAGKEEFFYDYFASDWRIKGVSANAEQRSILRIPGAS